jgi:hypothetical protein
MQVVDVEMNHVELFGALKNTLEQQHVVRQLGHAALVEAQRPARRPLRGAPR